MTERARGGNRVVPVLAWLVLALLIGRAWQVAPLTSSGIDFYQFWAASRAVAVAPELDIYSDADRARIGRRFLVEAEAHHARVKRDFELAEDKQARAPEMALAMKRLETARFRQSFDTVSTPFLYTCFRPFASGDYDGDAARFALASLLAGVLGVVGLARALGYGSTRALVAVALFVFAFEPTRSDLRVGNVNLLQLGAVAAALLLGRGGTPWRVALSGVVWGLAVAFKPNVAFALFVPALGWLAERRFARVGVLTAGVLAGATGAALAAGRFFGSIDAWSRWLGELPRLAERSYPVSRGNYGLVQLLSERTGTDFSGLLLLGLLGVAALAAVLSRLSGADGQARWQVRRGRELERDVVLAGLGGAVWLLGSPLAWLHYSLLLVPLVLGLLGPGAGGEARRWRVARYVATAPALAAVAVVPLAEWIGLDEAHELALLSVAGILTLFALGCLDLFARGARSNRPG